MTTKTRPRGADLVRGIGWLLVVSGAVILLYVVYLLWFTGFETDRAQDDLADAWAGQLTPDVAGDPDDEEAGAGDEGASDDAEPRDPQQPSTPPDTGGAFAALWFERDGEPILHEDPLYVIQGVTLDLLKSGPGHYPDSALPGGAGNLAIAGHRTTYGSPFWSVDELRDGDTIHVVDRDRREWVYDYREQRVVQPVDTWVVADDPLGTARPTITLTTCHPRGSAARRLIVWGELQGDPHEDGRETDEGSGSPDDELAEA